MRSFKWIIYLISIVLLLLTLILISQNITFIPSVNTAVFLVISLVCIFLGVLIIRIIYRSVPERPRFRKWFLIIFTSLILLAGILFGVLYAAVDNKAAGLFTTYNRSYKFKKVTFYLYETNLLGTSYSLRYSERYEIISHEIKDLDIWQNDANSITITEDGAKYKISSPQEKYIFSLIDKSLKQIQ